ncbi:hypothetical protein CR513_06225, partial [Mucuna pruriens]
MGSHKENFCPASKIASIRKKICSIRQYSGETLYEYYERFNKLCATCHHHQISEELLIQYFYEGWMLMDKRMINANATNGEALMDKTSIVARNLISNMPARVCAIYASTEHPTGKCLTLEETEPNSVEIATMMGGQEYRQPHDQYSN